MKHCLFISIFCLLGLPLLSSVAVAAGEEGTFAVVSDHRLLPVSGQNVMLSGGPDRDGVGEENQSVSTIEAIPTPTAFHTGAVLLLAILAGRAFRRLRLVRAG